MGSFGYCLLPGGCACSVGVGCVQDFEVVGVVHYAQDVAERVYRGGGDEAATSIFWGFELGRSQRNCFG
jgi:hypothetical protein